MTSSPIDRLTDPQRECLRLVLMHHSSKEIALRLGVSPSAVDKRLERAVQLLGAASRFDAARRLAAAETVSPYEPLASDLSDLNEEAAVAEASPQDAPIGLVRRLFGLDRTVVQAGGVRNPLSVGQRAFVVMVLIAGLAVSALVMVTVASTLTRLVQTERDAGVAENGPAAQPQPRTG